MSKSTATQQVVTQGKFLDARKALLKKEKELTRLRDELAALRRELPWVKVEKDYVFQSPGGPQTLAQLFEGRDQLIIYHFMFAPGAKEGCPVCSFLCDHLDGSLPHLAQRNTSLAVVSRAPIEAIEAFRKRMGWSFRWFSSEKNLFNYDFQVSFPKNNGAKAERTYNYGSSHFAGEDAPGLSVFAKNGDDVFHTYSTYARGLDLLIGAYNLLDLTPVGRNEVGLPSSMAWVRHHDRYPNNSLVNVK